jgi:hypothetical protein
MIPLLLVLVRKPAVMHKELLLMEMMAKLLMLELSMLRKLGG